jgi:hypothetical protein
MRGPIENAAKRPAVLAAKFEAARKGRRGYYRSHLDRRCPMPDVTPAIRSEIVSELESARHEFVAARDTTGVSTNYMGFGLADTTLSECVAAIGKMTDRAQIVDMLKRAYDDLPLVSDEPARPAIEHMRTTLVDLWKRLDPEA